MHATATLAGATGAFSCKIDNENLAFSTSGLLGAGIVPILRYEASADIGAKGVPDAIRNPDLSRALMHHWLFDLRRWFLFYNEAWIGNKQYMFQLVVMTEFNDHTQEYVGEYQLSAHSGDMDRLVDLTWKATRGW